MNDSASGPLDTRSFPQSSTDVYVAVLLMQDYDKYGVHSSEDKGKLFRLVKAENQGRSRVTADGIGLLRAEAERQAKQQPARRQSTVFNGRAYTAQNIEARPAEKVRYRSIYCREDFSDTERV